MNHKIEINYLDLTNHPSIKKHFEDMASRGWLIKRVVGGKVFIYKRIYPKELDFLIIPYEVKKGNNKKIQEEFEDFQNKYKNLAWDYITESRNLHIYFKEKSTDPVDLESGEKEVFKTIEKLAKKQLKRSYISIAMIILLIWFLSSGFLTYPSFMQNAFLQVLVLLIPIFIGLSIIEILRIKKFIEVNSKNIEIGKKIEYTRTKFYMKRAIFFFNLILAVLLTIYLVYVGVILKNSIVLFAMLYALTMLFLYSIILIPSRLFDENNKKSRIIERIILVITIVSIFFVNQIFIPRLLIVVKEYSDLDVEEFRVLAADKALNKDRDDEARIYQDISLLVPKSYKYSYFDSDEKTYTDTEYSMALNEDIAKTLVNVYIKDAKRQLKENKSNIEWAAEEDNYYIVEDMFGDVPEDFPMEKSLEELGLTLEEFNKIDKSKIRRAVNNAMKIIEDKAITKDKENLWDLDEVYFLSYDNRQVVIRDGEEVFYLEGRDFSDPNIIKTSKKQLDL